MGQNRYELAAEYVRRYHLDKIKMRDPNVFLDLHPSGEMAALQGYAQPTDQAAIFDLASGHILWQPEAVPALCWLPKSGNVLLICVLYQHDSELHEGKIKIMSPLQSEFLHYVECWKWPEKQRVNGCELTFPTGWPAYIAVSPREDLAVVQWHEQDDSGIEFFALTETGPRPLPEASYRAGTHLTDYPLFSPDGRYLVLACTTPFWWQPDAGGEDDNEEDDNEEDEDEEDEDLVSPGGRFQVGEIVVMNTQALTYHTLPVHEELPVGWAPRDPDTAPEDYMLQATEFLDATQISVRMMNDRTWILDLSS